MADRRQPRRLGHRPAGDTTCAIRRVISRRRARIGPAVDKRRSSPAEAASSASRGPSTKPLAGRGQPVDDVRGRPQDGGTVGRARPVD
jgi:hypothetical protein